MSRRLSRGCLPCPSVVILDSQSVKTTERGRHPWFRWAQMPPARGHPGDDGGPSGRSRQCVGPTRGGAAACRLTIRLPEIRTVMTDAGYENRKLACELQRQHGWRLHITKRRQCAFKVVGLTWIVEHKFAWLSQKLSLERRLRVECPNYGSLHRPGGHPPHAQTARPEVGRPAAYSVWQIFGADE